MWASVVALAHARTAMLAASHMVRAWLSTAILLVFSFAAPAYADPIKYALVNAMFDDGGQATGYIVYETPPAPENPRVTDWAITVTTGTTGITPFPYDPTDTTLTITSNLMTFVGPAYTATRCGGQPRSIQFDLLQFGALAEETCQATRKFVSGDFQQVPGPVLTLKANNQHPAGRVVYDGGSVLLRLDVSPAGWTTPLDWYFAIKADNGNVYWLTATGVSPAPAPLTHMAPVLLTDVPVLFAPLNGNTQTTFAIIATDGSSSFVVDHISVIVPPSP